MNKSFVDLITKSAPDISRLDSYFILSFLKLIECKCGGAIPILMNTCSGMNCLAFITVLISAIVSPTYATGGDFTPSLWVSNFCAK